jgi:hypothetical protein
VALKEIDGRFRRHGSGAGQPDQAARQQDDRNRARGSWRGVTVLRKRGQDPLPVVDIMTQTILAAK